MTSDSITLPPPTGPVEAEVATSRRRLLAAVAFAAFTLGVSVLLACRLTHTSRPLERAHMGLVSGAGGLYFSSYVLRALGWQKLFPILAVPAGAAA